jgi:hypothetical protein
MQDLRLSKEQFANNQKVLELVGKETISWILDNITSSDKDEFCIWKKQRSMETGIAGFGMLTAFADANGLSRNDIKIENNKLVLPYYATSIVIRSYIGNDVYYNSFVIRGTTMIEMELAVCTTVPEKKIVLPVTVDRFVILDNSPIDNIVLPAMLSRLEFRPKFNQAIDGFNWDTLTSLTEIAFCNKENDYKDFDQSSFNQPFVCLVKRLRQKLTFFGLNATVSEELQAQINHKLMANGKRVQVNYWWCWDDKPHKQHHKYTCTLDDIYL